MNRPALAGGLVTDILRAAAVGAAAAGALSLAFLAWTFGIDVLHRGYAAAAFEAIRFGTFCG